MFPLRAYRHSSGLTAKQALSTASAGRPRAASPLREFSIAQLTPGPACLSSEKAGDREERAVAVGYRRKRMSRADPTDRTLPGSTKVSVNPARPAATAAQTLGRTEQAEAKARNQRRREGRATAQSSPGASPARLPERSGLWEHSIRTSRQNGGCSDLSATSPAQHWWPPLPPEALSPGIGN